VTDLGRFFTVNASNTKIPTIGSQWTTAVRARQKPNGLNAWRCIALECIPFTQLSRHVFNSIFGEI
jgi:hypothetical protein